jgi:hypothetical protein
MRRLVLTADLSLDGFIGRDGLGPDWAREYDDNELVRYRRRVVLKAGVHALEDSWSVEALVELKAEGGAEEMAPIVAEGGPAFCQELTRRALVDEYRITVHPVVFGDGYRLFAAPDRLLSISTRHFASGSVAFTHVPERAYRDRPPPYPWALRRAQGPDEDHDDPQPEDPAEGPAPG